MRTKKDSERGARAGRSLGMIILLMVLGAEPAAAKLDAKKHSTPKPLPEFVLSDHKGGEFSKKNTEGRWTMFLLGYTHCPDICPFTLQNLALVYGEMQSMVTPDRLPQVVFVAVDRERDEAHLKEYVAHFDPSFVGVTGGFEDIKTLVEGLDGFFRLNKKNKDDTSYEVQHSAQVSIVNPKGEIAAILNPPFEPASAAAFLTGLMRDAKKKAMH